MTYARLKSIGERYFKIPLCVNATNTDGIDLKNSDEIKQLIINRISPLDVNQTNVNRLVSATITGNSIQNYNLSNTMSFAYSYAKDSETVIFVIFYPVIQGPIFAGYKRYNSSQTDNAWDAIGQSYVFKDNIIKINDLEIDLSAGSDTNMLCYYTSIQPIEDSDGVTLSPPADRFYAYQNVGNPANAKFKGTSVTVDDLSIPADSLVTCKSLVVRGYTAQRDESYKNKILYLEAKDFVNFTSDNRTNIKIRNIAVGTDFVECVNETAENQWENSSQSGKSSISFNLPVSSGINYEIMHSDNISAVPTSDAGRFVVDKVLAREFYKIETTEVGLYSLLFEGGVYSESEKYVYISSERLNGVDNFYEKFGIVSDDTEFKWHLNFDRDVVYELNPGDLKDGTKFKTLIHITGDSTSKSAVIKCYHAIPSDEGATINHDDYSCTIGLDDIKFETDGIYLYSPVYDTLQNFCTKVFPIESVTESGVTKNIVKINAKSLCIMAKQTLTFSGLEKTEVPVQPEKTGGVNDDYYNICFCNGDYKGNYDVDTDFSFSDVSEIIKNGINGENDFIVRFLVKFYDHEDPDSPVKFNILQLEKMDTLIVSWENCKEITPVLQVKSMICTDENITIQTVYKTIYIHNGDVMFIAFDYRDMFCDEGIPSSATTYNNHGSSIDSLRNCNSYLCSILSVYTQEKSSRSNTPTGDNPSGEDPGTDDNPKGDDTDDDGGPDTCFNVFISNLPIRLNDSADSKEKVFSDFKAKVDEMVGSNVTDLATAAGKTIDSVFLLVFICYRYRYETDSNSNTLFHYYKTLLRYDAKNGSHPNAVLNVLFNNNTTTKCSVHTRGNDDNFISINKDEDTGSYVISLGGDIDLNTTDVVTVKDLSIDNVDGEDNDINDYMENNGCNRNDCTYNAFGKDSVTNADTVVKKLLPIEYNGKQGIELKEIRIDEVKFKCYIKSPTA